MIFSPFAVSPIPNDPQLGNLIGETLLPNDDSHVNGGRWGSSLGKWGMGKSTNKRFFTDSANLQIVGEKPAEKQK